VLWSAVLRSAVRVRNQLGVRVLSVQPRTALKWGLTSTAAAGMLTYTLAPVEASTSVNYDDVRKTIAGILDAQGYDDGSFGPVFVRLAWHASGTYDKHSRTGGSNGATMRFKPECDHGANAGLHVARKVLEKVKEKYPEISYADLWTLAGVVAVEEMGGPKIKWFPGRTDAVSGDACPPDGRLPDATQGAPHLRDTFYKMGFNDQEIVALAGAHCLGRCHTDRSGFSGPWTRAPTTFSNLFFKELVENKWTEKKWSGPKQLEDPTGALMMLPADMSLIEDPAFKVHVDRYAQDSIAFEKDFAKAFSKLLALGVKNQSSNPNSCTYFLGLVTGIAGLAASSRLN